VPCCNNHQKDKNKHTITKIPDKLWDKIRTIFTDNMIGRPIIPYRKVLNGIIYVLRTGYQWKMLPREYGSGSTCHRRFQQWIQIDSFKKIWIRLLKEYDHKKGIKWVWQLLDSISIKYPLGGR